VLAGFAFAKLRFPGQNVLFLADSLVRYAGSTRHI
jgi:flagellar biosynthesis/type III secretory pathway ATPase